MPAPTDLLPRAFFARSATDVAPDLLGCVFWSASPAGLVAVRLVEVEAYEGERDPASHAYRGQTTRNEVMFGPPGHAYVYFTYGMHYCVNLVCQPPGQASAVLLRAGEVIEGAELAAARRSGPARRGAESGSGPRGSRQSPGLAPLRVRDLARGPGRLCQALGIDRSLNGTDVCAPGAALGISPPRAAVAADQIRTGPRVGISRAADWPLRFWLAADGHVSSYKGNGMVGGRGTTAR